MKYEVGHYYKRRYNGFSRHFRVFKVLDVFDRDNFMFVLVVRDGILRHEYECSLIMNIDDTETVELNEPEQLAVVL